MKLFRKLKKVRFDSESESIFLFYFSCSLLCVCVCLLFLLLIFAFLLSEFYSVLLFRLMILFRFGIWMLQNWCFWGSFHFCSLYFKAPSLNCVFLRVWLNIYFRVIWRINRKLNMVRPLVNLVRQRRSIFKRYLFRVFLVRPGGFFLRDLLHKLVTVPKRWKLT